MNDYAKALFVRKLIFHQIMVFSVVPLVALTALFGGDGPAYESPGNLLYLFFALGLVLTVVSFFFRKRFLNADAIAPKSEAQVLAAIGTGSVLCTIPADISALAAAAYYLLTRNRNQAYLLLFFWGLQYSLTTIALNRVVEAVKNKARLPTS